jgi:L-ascorbate metabolism protein UlaG (beta-lactamase superfamily)
MRTHGLLSLLIVIPPLAPAALAGCDHDPSSGGDTKPAQTTTPTSPTATATATASSDGAAPAPPTRTDTFTTPQGELDITPIHHATFLMQVGGKNVYFDPVLAGASFDALPPADLVFVTDIHTDHMDVPGLSRVHKDGTVVVGPQAVADKVHVDLVMKNGDSHDFGAFTVDAIPMYNMVRGPSPGTFYHDKGRGDGFVFTFKGDAGAGGPGTGGKVTRLYVSGDTECIPEMKALTNIDVAFECMNLPYTMPPSEAAACANAFKPKVVFPYHYRGSNLDEFTPQAGIEVRKRAWY